LLGTIVSLDSGTVEKRKALLGILRSGVVQRSIEGFKGTRAYRRAVKKAVKKEIAVERDNEPDQGRRTGGALPVLCDERLVALCATVWLKLFLLFDWQAQVVRVSRRWRLWTTARKTTPRYRSH
jgi:hypothetical protein